MPNPPLLLVDNVFDTIALYPGGILTADTEAVGHEIFRIADYRRDRTWWQTSAYIGVQAIVVQLPVAVAVDYLFFDRGHNIPGGTAMSFEGSNDGITYDVGGSHTAPSSPGTGVYPSYAVTEEGAMYTQFTPLPARRWWRLRIVPWDVAVMPIITGLMAGTRTQFLRYGKTFDEDAGGRTQPSQQSTAGYRANDPTYSWRTVTLDLDLIGATEYDNTMRTVRARLFEKNQPYVCVMDYGTRPERAWMYTYDGTAWGMPKSHVYRAGRIVGREHMPRLG